MYGTGYPFGGSDPVFDAAALRQLLKNLRAMNTPFQSKFWMMPATIWAKSRSERMLWPLR